MDDIEVFKKELSNLINKHSIKKRKENNGFI